MRTIRHFLLYGISKGLLLKIIIALAILLVGKNVFAQEFNLNSYISAIQDGTKNRYRGTENYLYGNSNTYSFGTRYNGRLSDIEIYIDYPFEQNTTYTLTYNMNTEDFRNNFGTGYWWDCDHSMSNTNATTFSTTFVSMKKVKMSFKPTANTMCIRVWLRANNDNTNYITGTNNWRLDNITIYDPDWQSGSGSGQGSSSSSSSSDNTNTDIINNATQNTQDIINNNNENTQNIIDNQTELLGSKCENLLDQKTIRQGDITSDTQTLRLNSRQVLELEPGTYIINTDLSSDFDWGIQIQNEGIPPLSTWPSYFVYETGWLPNGTSGRVFTISEYGYFNIMIKKHNNTALTPSEVNGFNWRLFKGQTLKPYCEFGSYTSKLDDTNNSINDINNSLTNDNVDSGTGSDFFNSFETDDNGGISAIVTKPLTLINTLLSSNNQCTNLTLPTFLGVSNAYLPSGCILWNNASPIMINLWNIFVCGFGSYFILKDIFRIVENLKNPDNDEVEVLDL